MNDGRGYTLLEVLAVLAIVGILIAVGAPSLEGTIRRNARDTSMMELMSSLALARTEAVTQVGNVSVCRSTNQSSCAGAGDWSSGWLVFSDRNVTGTTAGVVDAGVDEILLIQPALNDQWTITLSGATSIQFDANGFLQNAGNGAYFKYCDADNSAAAARAVWIFNTGRASLSMDTDDDGVHNDMSGNNLSCP